MDSLLSISNCSAVWKVLTLPNNYFEGRNSLLIFGRLQHLNKHLLAARTDLESKDRDEHEFSFLLIQLNHLAGSIPSSIGNLLGLTTFSLSENNFTGLIPESIGKLQNLQILDLAANYFFGVIPRSIGNLSLLTKVVLAENSLEGSIPSDYWELETGYTFGHLSK
uniref:Putative leucine-rich repeat domain, L domain-like protein n=1 Tax=Helianthus annuus TaxID=4232 RepID=A0A1Y3BXJ8_HELAN